MMVETWNRSRGLLGGNLHFVPNMLPQTPVIAKNGNLFDLFLGLAIGPTAILNSTYRDRPAVGNHEFRATRHENLV